MSKKIKLLIEVDEENYQLIKGMADVAGMSFCEILRNGTPYNPTDDLISRSELQERREADKPCEWVEKQFEYEDETSEETRTDTILVCPKCGKQKQPFGRVNFCYWCGARFVKESEREKTMAEDLHDFLIDD